MVATLPLAGAEHSTRTSWPALVASAPAPVYLHRVLTVVGSPVAAGRSSPTRMATSCSQASGAPTRSVGTVIRTAAGRARRQQQQQAGSWGDTCTGLGVTAQPCCQPIRCARAAMAAGVYRAIAASPKRALVLLGRQPRILPVPGVAAARVCCKWPTCRDIQRALVGGAEAGAPPGVGHLLGLAVAGHIEVHRRGGSTRSNILQEGRGCTWDRGLYSGLKKGGGHKRGKAINASSMRRSCLHPRC